MYFRKFSGFVNSLLNKAQALATYPFKSSHFLVFRGHGRSYSSTTVSHATLNSVAIFSEFSHFPVSLLEMKLTCKMIIC